MTRHQYLKNIATLRLDVDKCTGCGLCADVCPHIVFEIQDGKAKITDIDACMECGACAHNCPVHAISVNSGVGCAAAIIAGTVKGTQSPRDCCCDDRKRDCC